MSDCSFGITLRYDPDDCGEFWSLAESYDPYKMQHSHEIKNVRISPLVNAKIVKQIDEDPIDSDNDTYGDEDMKFDDQDPLDNENNNKPQVDIFDPADSPISDEFSQKNKILERIS